MKCSFFKALFLQFKRAIRMLPASLVATVFLCLSIGVFAFGIIKSNSESEEKSLLRVAYVGELSEYMGINLDSVINIISEEFGVTLEQMTEEEAKKEMYLGHLSTYVIFPEGFVGSIDEGRNDLKITYVTSEGNRGIASIILSESLDSVSEIMTSSQGTFYSLYDFLKANGKRELYFDASTDLENAMINSIIGIIGASAIETVGVSNGISFTGYYLCAAILIFVSLSGIGSAAFFTNRNNEFQRIARRNGQNEVFQVIQEFLCFLFIQFVCSLFVYFTLFFAIKKGIFVTPELGRNPIKVFNLFAFRVLTSGLCLYSMQFLIYEIMESTLSAVLTQFLAAIALGYISGFYYPMAFLPEKLTNITKYTPTGASLMAVTRNLSGNPDLLFTVILVGYMILFLSISVLIRHYKITLDR